MAERRGGAAEGLARLSEWADAHLSLLRSLSSALAVAAVLVLARSVRMTTKFTSASDIPAAFVEKNVKLRGKLHHVTEKGLEVEHVPISVPFFTSLQRRAGPGAAAGAAGGGAAGARRPGLAAAAPPAHADCLVPAPREGGRGARVPGFSKQGPISQRVLK